MRHSQRPRREDPLIRCLFINWNDGTPASQFTVPDDYRLSQKGLDGSPLPRTLEVFDELCRAEIYIDLTKIKSAMTLDIAADRVISAGALG